MLHQLIDELVDIYQLPSVDTRHEGKAGTQITIGDLHGNAIKLMFMLVKHGIATNINEEDYNRLVEIYKTILENLIKNDLDEFNQILSKIKFNNDALVRLIGDELADRGMNDYFTLKILEKLNEHHVPVEIIISNHSIEFVEAYEKLEDFSLSMLDRTYAESMINLQSLVQKNIVTREEILAIADRSYKPTLKAISYSLSDDKENITIYSHAPIGLQAIQSLARKLKIEYKDATASELAQTIDNINTKFQEHVQNNTVNTLYTREKMFVGYHGRCELSDAPFEYIMWNRFYEHLDRPAVYSGYQIHFVHGHDSPYYNRTKVNVYNLDNMLGKCVEMNKGHYTALYSLGNKITPESIITHDSKDSEINSIIKVDEIEEAHVNQTVENKIKPTVITPSDLHQSLVSQLQKMKDKERDLRNRGYIKAADDANNLYQMINSRYEELIDQKIDVDTFKKDCTEAITKARPELEKHRGWKQVLGNLALAIVGIGVLYVIAGLINKKITGNFLFFKTDSSHKIDQLEEAVKSMNAPQKPDLR